MRLLVPDIVPKSGRADAADKLEGKFLDGSDISATREKSLLAYALHYASMGVPVFPAHSMVQKSGLMQCSCRQGSECLVPGKHPRTRKGHNDATTLEISVREWWNRWSNANIGMVTGRRSGFFVVDIDPKNGGFESWEGMKDDYRYLLKGDYEPVPPTLIAKTGSGGFHYFFKYPNDVSISTSASTVRPGIDIRSDGGYVIAPPSSHKSGEHYKWWSVNSEIQEAPNWLIAEILEADESPILESESEPQNGKKYTGEEINEGNRNAFLFKYGCGLVNSCSEREVSARIREMNEICCFPPLPEREVSHILGNIEKYRGRP